MLFLVKWQPFKYRINAPEGQAASLVEADSPKHLAEILEINMETSAVKFKEVKGLHFDFVNVRVLDHSFRKVTFSSPVDMNHTMDNAWFESGWQTFKDVK